MNRIINAVLLLLPCLYVYSQDIAQWRGPNRTGIYNETGLLRKWPESGPKLLWHYNGLGEGHTSVAVTTEGVYTTGMMGGKGYVFAFDHSGRLLWRSEYGPEWNLNYDGTRSTPHIVGNKLYLMSGHGKLVCMDCSNGLIIWSVDLVREYGGRNITYGMVENLLSDGNIIYCSPGGINAGMVALDRNTGKLIWKCGINGEISTFNVTMGSGPHWAHPVIHNKRLYIRHSNALMAYDIASSQ